MRWGTKYKIRPSVGGQRIVKKFIWIPKQIDGEWRWFEFSKIKQSYTPTHYWKSEKWID